MKTSHEQSLLIVSQFYWPEEIGSAPIVTELAEWFAKRGADVTVLAARPHYPDYEVAKNYTSGKLDDERRNGVRIRRLPTWIPLGSRAAGRILLETTLLAYALLHIATGRNRRFDRVISVCPSVLLVLAGWAATRRGGIHTSIIHDIQSGLADGLGMVRSKTLKRLMVLAERIILNRTTRIGVLTEAMRDILRRQGVLRPIDVVPIWVDTEFIRPLPRRLTERPVVLYSGNLGRKQGLEQVLGAARVIAADAPDVCIVIRGRGGRKDALRDEASRLGLTNVEFRDLAPRERLNDCLAEADVHLVPQAPDGADFAVPSKAYSIMAAGRPFVTTAKEGTSLAKLEQESRAFLRVSPGDDQAFAKAILHLVRSPEECREFGRRGREYIMANLARDAVLSRLSRTLWGI